MKKYKIDAIPFSHPDLDKWRDNFTGIQYLHPSGLLITGAIDDIWINPKKELHIVDYKSTSTAKEISLEDEYKQGYKRQMEIYQWLFKMNDFKVSDIGYFVFANATKLRADFDAKLEFDMTIIEYKGDTDWIDGKITEIAKCLKMRKAPKPTEDCKFCGYVEQRTATS